MHAGVYRASVVDVKDPKERKRYRVRVDGITPASVPIEACPWAESSLFGGKMFGDLYAFLVGDKVWVMFEKGDKRFPVIMGGALTEKDGVPDLPADVVSDYNTTQQRWVRIDRAGNVIIMSPLSDERHIILKTGGGGASIKLSDNGDTVSIDAKALVRVKAPRVEVDATDCSVKADELHAEVAKTATIKCEGTVNIRAKTQINIGRYEDTVLGALKPHTTGVVDIRADTNIKRESKGTVDLDATGAVTDDTQDTHLIHAVKTMDIQGDEGITLESKNKDVNVKAGQDLLTTVARNATTTVTGTLNVTISDDVTLTASKTATITISGDATITVGGNLSVTTSGNGTVTSSGSLSVSAGGELTLSGATVDVKASGLLTLDGSVVEIG